MTADPELVRSWSLVLDSQGIPHQIVREGDDWQLVVHPRDAERAAEALAAYASENAPPAARPEPTAGRAWAAGALAAAAALMVFSLATGPWRADSPWFGAGAADGALIRQGQLWRTVTALTLHADMGHALANAVSVALFGGALGSVVGPGVALLLMVASGAVGNLLDVLVRSAPYQGVGASTAVFGAVGLLAGVQMARPWADPGRRRAALVAGILLLALLGMGQHSDVLAHVLGFAVGVPMGVAEAKTFRKPADRRAQAAWGLLAVAVILGAWWLALRAYVGPAGLPTG